MRRCLPKVGRKKKILLEELSALDITEEEMALGKEERMKKEKVLSKLECSPLMEEVSWRQKSKALWLREVCWPRLWLRLRCGSGGLF
jgi:hypothetical protein